MEREIQENTSPKKSAKESTSGCISHDHDSNFNEVTNNDKSCYVSSSSSFHATTPTTPSKSCSKSNFNIFVSLYKNIKASLSKPIALLRKTCSCFDKHSLQVKENNTSTPKASTSTTSSPTPQVQTLSQDQIAIKSVSHKTTSKGKLKIDDDDDDHNHGHEKEDEDVASDASSDLFEIESTQSYPIRPTMIECHETTTSNVLCDT
ncbi:unnamed protein product [Lathyrus sativus]|nr:unnamed protein product [Lathyrus sativus]